MLENIIKADKDDLIQHEKLAYVQKRYRYYWETTHNPKYLYLYQKNFKEYVQHGDYIKRKYFKDLIYKYFQVDINNGNIYYY